MPRSSVLPRSFFNRPTLVVARQLLGQRWVKREKNRQLVGIITEVEAYIGESDLACHARAGLTARTAIMYGSPGHLYVYLNYGLHWMLNIVTERAGFPAAILIRGLHVTEGGALIRQRRHRDDHLTDGPAKIAQAFAIDKSWNGYDLCDPDSADLFLEHCPPVPRSRIRTAPRVGLGATPEPWFSQPWNYSYTPSSQNPL